MCRVPTRFPKARHNTRIIPHFPSLDQRRNKPLAPTIMNTPLNTKTRRAVVSALLLTVVGYTSAQENPPLDKETSEEEQRDVVVLNPFIVSQEDEAGYGFSQSVLGTRTVQPVLNIPTSVVSINREFLDDLNATTVADALNYGVSGVTNSTSNSDDVNIRGFRSNQALRDGVMVVNFKRNPMYDIDRVEVIKGPSGLLLGNTLFLGGVVNYVSKLPTAKREGSISATVGSLNASTRITADVSGPIKQSDDLTVLYRVTVGGEMGDPKRKIQTIDQRFAGVAMTFKYFSDRLRLDTVYYNFVDDGYAYFDDFLDIQRSIAGGPAILNTYSTDTFSAASRGQAYWNQKQDYFNATMTGRLTENGNIRMYYSHHRVVDRRALLRAIGVQADNRTLNRQDLPFSVDNKSNMIQLEYLYKTIRQNWRNDFQVGADTYFETFWQRFALYTPPPLDSANPDYTYSRQAFTGYNFANGRSEKRFGTYWLQDNLTLLNDRLILIGGLRWVDSHVVNTNLNAKTNSIDDQPVLKTHRYGVVYKPMEALSLYFADAINVTATGGLDGYGRTLKNQEGKLKEYGIKIDTDFHNLALTGTLAYFDMANTNVLTTFTDPQLGLILVQDPTGDTAKGWEAEIRARLKTDNGFLDVVATYYEADTNRISTGGPALEAPGHAYSLFGKYSWESGALQGFSVGAGMFDQSKKLTGAYTTDYPKTYSLLAKYSINKNWSIQVNGDNVTDERYIMFVANPALVITSLSANYRLTVKYKW